MKKKQPKTLMDKFGGWVSEQKELLKDVKSQVKELREERQATRSLGDEKKKERRPKAKQERTKVDISVVSVIKAAFATVLVLLSIYFLYLITDTLILVMVSLFVAAMINPLVSFMERYKIPRGVGVILTYILIAAVIIFSILAFAPVLKNQGDKIISSISTYLQSVANEGFTSLSLPFISSEQEAGIITWLNDIRENINLDLVFQQMSDWFIENRNAIGENLGTLSNNFFGFVNNVASGLGNLVIVLLLTFFVIVEKEELKGFAVAALPNKHREYFNTKLRTIQTKIGAWVRGQVLLGLAVGFATYIGFLILWLFGIYIEEMLILSVLAGITEVVPVVGPLLAGTIAALVAANLGLLPMLSVIIMFIVIQQLENNILVPVIMRHAVGLSSFVIIVGMLIGVTFFGFLGLILAVPITTILGLFVTDLLGSKNGDKKEAA